jgi:hypothetical protein
VPDVSASADPAHGTPIYFGGGWQIYGGTSAAAPEWAAVTALADDANGCTAGLVASDLYANRSATTNITTGNNDYTDTHSGQYASGTGYSMATGLGSPIGSALATVLDGVDCASLSSLSTNTGPTGGGQMVTLTGARLTGATHVLFGTTTVAATVVSSTEVTAVTPAMSAGTVPVTVQTSTGASLATTAADDYDYVAPPAVTAVSASAGPLAGGTSVTITGVALTNASAVLFGTTAATSFTVNSGTAITAVAPAGIGTVDVTVTAPGGTSTTTSADHYTYLAVPTVTAINPNHGSLSGGTSVSITGTGFTDTSAVYFGTNAATSFNDNSTTSITAVAPAGTGTVDVAVTTPGGTSTTSSADHFSYVVVPGVSSLSPNAGPLTSGTSVTITGTNFTNATAVTFGSTSAASYSINSATSITAVAPAESAGTVNVTVTASGGTSTTDTGDEFTYLGTPTVTEVNPGTGSTSGGTSVTITGTSLLNTSAVSFGSTPATSFSLNSNTSITAVAPAGSVGTVNVTTITPDGTSAASSANDYI